MGSDCGILRTDDVTSDLFNTSNIANNYLLNYTLHGADFYLRS